MGVDNIPTEILKYGGSCVIIAFTVICQNIWTSGPWPKVGNSRLCQIYITIRLISHPSKVMPRVILNRLVNQAEQILEEEQSGFRSRRSTTEQIFNLRVLVEKDLEHQKELLGRNFHDFQKALNSIVSG